MSKITVQWYSDQVRQFSYSDWELQNSLFIIKRQSDGETHIIPLDNVKIITIGP